MSEKLHHAPKQEKALHMEASVDKALEYLDKLKDTAEVDAQDHANIEKLNKIQNDVEAHAVSGKEMTPGEGAEDGAPTTGYVNKELKEISFDRSLRNVRRHLRAPEKTFSKVIHQPVVDKVSEVAGKTVARPSGIIGGGLFAIVGSTMLLFITKKYGFEYNYLMFFMLFVAGFVTGMVVELLVKLLIKNKHAH
jgi:hypothetical protein